MAFTVFILSCSDQSFHFGVTKNLGDRLAYHEEGKNPLTKSKLPVELVYQTTVEELRDAQATVSELKSYSEEKLYLLIAGKIEIKPASLIHKAKQKTINPEIAPLILPAVYLGNLSYFETVSKCSMLILDSEERYEKQTFRSRCTILSANGLQNLVIPVIRTNGKDTRMKNVQISYVENWQKDHLKAIESAYRKAPFYDYYAKDLFTILRKKHVRLIDLNLELTRFILKALGSTCTVELGNETHQSTVDHKKLVHPKTQPKCDQKPYQQVFASSHFESNLSCLDFLFNVGKWG